MGAASSSNEVHHLFTFYEFQESSVLGLEAVVEAFGNPLDIESGAGAARDIYYRELFFFLKAEDNRLELLKQGIARLIAVVPVLSTCRRLACLPLDPLPYLGGFAPVCVDDEVVVDRFGALLFK